jgi:hypothetical protein
MRSAFFSSCHFALVEADAGLLFELLDEGHHSLAVGAFPPVEHE